MNAHTMAIPDIRITPVQDTNLSDIDIPENRARELDHAWAQALAFSIAGRGLINAITVRVVGDRKQLVTGLHRHAAFTLLGRDSIPTRISVAATDDDARMEEVSENLIRHDLTARDRCHHLFELKQIYERQHPETKNGGDRKSIRTQTLRSDPEGVEIFTFASDAAEKTGLSRRAIEIAVKIWKELTPDSRMRTVGTRLANNQSSLKELSEQSPADQVKVLDMLLSAKPSASTVAEAVAIIGSGVALSPSEKKAATVKRTLDTLPVAAKDKAVASEVEARLAEMKKSISVLSKFFADLKDDELDSVIDQNEERIIASLKRRGRI